MSSPCPLHHVPGGEEEKRVKRWTEADWRTLSSSSPMRSATERVKSFKSPSTFQNKKGFKCDHIRMQWDSLLCSRNK